MNDLTQAEMDNFNACLKAGDVFDYTDPITGLYVRVSYDHDKGAMKVEKSVADTSPILHLNDEIRAANTTSWKGDYHYVARIPLLAQSNYCLERGITQREFMQDPNEFKRMLNDPGNASLRLKKGQL